MPDRPPHEPLRFAASHGRVAWPIARLFRKYGSDHVPLVVVAVLASVSYPLLSLIPIYLLQTAIDAVLLGQEPFVLPGLTPALLPHDPFHQLSLVAAIMTGTALIAAALGALSGLTWGRFAQEVQHAVRMDVYDRIQRLGMRFFDEQQSGQILSILQDDVDNLNRLLEGFLKELVETIVRFVGIAAVLLLLHWQLALFALLLLPILAILGRYFVSRIRPLYHRVRQRIGALNARLENNLGGMPVIKAYTGESYEAERVALASRSVYDARWAVITTQATFFPSMSGVNWVGFGCLLVLGGYWYLVGPPAVFDVEMSVGILVAFLLYNQQLTTPMMQASHLVDLYFEARASVVRVFALQDRDIEVPNPTDAIAPPAVIGGIEVDDVTFAYDADDGPALRDVSVEVPAGAFVGIVGPTGSGKTTLVKLLLRFYDPDLGRIRLDGHDLRSLDLHRLRHAIGFVSQEPYLFSGTVRENVAYARSDIDDAAVRHALRLANAWMFVEAFPDGLDTTVGQRGVRLSGGQRQRIALARAILADPEILILDEATSHVDTETEASIHGALRELAAARTTFAIAHRLSTVRHADHILVLVDGEIVERGTHEELVAAGGRYATLWRVQIGEPDAQPAGFAEPGAGD